MQLLGVTRSGIRIILDHRLGNTDEFRNRIIRALVRATETD